MPRPCPMPIKYDIIAIFNTSLIDNLHGNLTLKCSQQDKCIKVENSVHISPLLKKLTKAVART